MKSLAFDLSDHIPNIIGVEGDLLNRFPDQFAPFMSLPPTMTSLAVENDCRRDIQVCHTVKSKFISITF